MLVKLPLCSTERIGPKCFLDVEVICILRKIEKMNLLMVKLKYEWKSPWVFDNVFWTG